MKKMYVTKYLKKYICMIILSNKIYFIFIELITINLQLNFIHNINLTSFKEIKF